MIMRLGTEYGGHYLDVSRVAPGSTVLDIGVGMDFSFASQLYVIVADCRFVFVDPDPSGFRKVMSAFRRCECVPAALSCQDGEVQFWEDGLKSGTIIPFADATPRVVGAMCPQTLCGFFHPGIVKIDAEGAEVGTASLFAQQACVEQITVEFHHYVRKNVTRQSVRDEVAAIRRCGFEEYAFGSEFLFVRK